MIFKIRDFEIFVILKIRDFQKFVIFKIRDFEIFAILKIRDFQKFVIFNKPHKKLKKRGWGKPLPLIMELYFLDDGSLIINKVRSTTLIPPDQFEIVRTIGCHYLSHLSGI